MRFTPTATAAEKVVTDASKIFLVMKDGEKPTGLMCSSCTMKNKFGISHCRFHRIKITTINVVELYKSGMFSTSPPIKPATSTKTFMRMADDGQENRRYP